MKFRFFLLYLITIFAVLGVIFVSKTFAVSQSSILVDVIPPSPAPYEDVSITLSSYGSDLDSVSISWSVNGKTVLSGIGKKAFLLKAPAAGSEATVVALISLPEGSIEKRIIIRPAVMVLLYQANDSYVPPFYRGKALPTPDSEIKVVAMPEVRSGGKFVNSKNMTYAWKKDYSNDQEASGYGKNFFLYTNDYLEGSNTVSVEASTVDQSYSSEASINIGTVESKILFYKNDTTLGTIWGKTLVDPHKISGTEIVEAIPYFISPKELENPTLKWSWSINNNSVGTQSYKKNLMPLRAESGTSGISLLKLTIENQYRIFQTATKEINIEF